VQVACARQPGSLRVLAAASLSDLFQATTGAYAEPTTLQLGASSQLASQVENGAPADVIVTADAASMDRLEQKGLLLAGTRRTLYTNHLVVIAPVASPVKDISEAKRIGIGQPDTVPAGRYAREALRHEKLWTRVESRLVYGQDVRVVLGWAAKGEVDAAVVYATDARAASDRVKILATFPDDSHAPIVYPGAVLSSSTRPDDARRLLDWLSSPQAREKAGSLGFGAP